MKIDILTLFPEMFSPLFKSILGRAIEKEKIEINTINIRDFSKDKHKKCDDVPFGGGAGMVMTPQPIYDAVKSVMKKESKLIYLSPKGKVFNQSKAVSLSKEKHLIFICGHYEGIDERIIDIFKPELISIGDFVLTGGEIPAMAIIDAVSRNIEGVLKEGSLDEESHTNGLLEYSQYTRPQNFMGIEVPNVLTSGNHQEIKKWRDKQSIEETKKYRTDLLKKKEKNGKN
ncbi:MAG: tRNA (guanosine(37)-N1)-methyltransferase TrmD [Clostridia bacterium]|nr:tRNA (guanosine(37)-N1)-methyltransferase TrmD [Clostridia bacterium]